MRFSARALLALSVLAFVVSAPAAAQQDTAKAAAKDTMNAKPLPLVPARKLEYTARNGSWISVDVSPDGRTIAFDLLGDLYTMPIEGGRATRLTSGLAFDAQPRFSPDGKQIVFVSDRSGGDNVWIMSLDMQDTTQVTKGNTNLYLSPEWTPDGDYVVATKANLIGGAGKIWMYHVKGGGGSELVKGAENQKAVGAAFGPDPRYVWFAARQGDWQYNAVFPQYQVAVYDRDTGKQTQMTGRYGSAFRPTISRDGKWLVYGTRHDTRTGLRLRELASGEERWLAFPVQRDDQESRATLDVLPGLSFTPDSRAVVTYYGGEIWRVPVDGSAAVKIPFTADVSVDIGPRVAFEYEVDDAPTFTIAQIRDATPSPDGKRLAFTSLDRLYVMDYPSGTPRRLSSDDTGEFYPTWSPDGRSIAYTTWDDRAGGHVMSVRADGRGKPARLSTVAADYRAPAWSPDGRRVIAVRNSARAFQEGTPGMGAEFVWVPASGGAANLIAPTAGRHTPHFTKDAERIFAYSGRDGLVSFRWDGTDEKVHLKAKGVTLPQNKEPSTASLALMSPDGQRALIHINNHLYVAAVPYLGDTPTINVANPSNAAFPVRKLTEVGAEFPRWGRDSDRVHWSFGNAHFVYDLERAEQVDDSVRLAKREEARRKASKETTSAASDSVEVAADSAKAKADKDEPAYRAAEHRIRVAAQRDIPNGVAVLRGGRAVTMKGDEIIEDADIVVRDNRIVAVGRRGSVEVPAGAQVIDVAGKTIVPGFVDTHSHMWSTFGTHNREVWLYLANLAYGVTTTRDPQTSTSDVLTYGDRVETGDLIGPRIYSTGPGVFGSYIDEPIRDYEHAENVLRRYSDYFDTKTIKMYMSGNRQQRQWIIKAANKLGLMPTTEGGLDYRLDVTQMLDGYPGIEHALPITPLYEDVVRLLNAAGTVNTPTLLVAYGGPFAENYFFATETVHDDAKLRRFTPHEELDALSRRRGGSGAGWFMKEEHVFPQLAEFVDQVMDAGGCMGVGSHGQLQGLGYHWEMWAMGAGGASNHDILRAATICGARAIGLAGDLGSIEAGKLADLVVLDGDPLRELRNTNTVRYVMKNGRLYEGATLDEIYPRKLPLERRGYTSPEPQVAAGIR